jgi:hypothetical protein
MLAEPPPDFYRMFDTPSSPSEHEQRTAHYRSLVPGHQASVADTTAAAIRFWRHRRQLGDVPHQVLAANAYLSDPLTVVEWFRQHGWPAQALHTGSHQMDDLVWVDDERGARFVVCQGEQPGLRMGYWDPLDGAYHWVLLAQLRTAEGPLRQLVVRPKGTPQVPTLPAPTRSWLFARWRRKA